MVKRLEIRQVKDFPCYWVTEDSRIFRITEVKPFKNSVGRLRVRLCKDGKRFWKFVYRVSFEAFKRPLRDGEQVNHIDYDTDNNHITNIEGSTLIKNIRHRDAKKKPPF